MDTTLDPLSMLRPKRAIRGYSAILLPLLDDDSVDWPSFEAHVARTAGSGLVPAVNMDTGYVNLIDNALQDEVLDRTRAVLDGGPFVAGAFVGDREGDRFQPDAYAKRMDAIQARGGTPVIFQSYGLTRQPGPEIVAAYRELAKYADEYIGFELMPELAPFGAVYDLETYEGMLSVPQCIGAKHSSFRREPEWQRLQLRDRVRPEFRVMTGNDFGIDMVMYGSDYLLGLSTFAPDLFALRDTYWESGDPRFYELNDQLQYLGFFAFRRPSPAYKHTAAQFLKLRGWITTSRTHPNSPKRPESDVPILLELGNRLGAVEP